MKTIRFSVLVMFLLAVSMPGAAAADMMLLLSVKPDSEFCTNVIFGDDGTGEYTLTVEDPGYPGKSWTDTHHASFNSGPANPVIIPVCISTDGRRKGSEAILTMVVDTPVKTITEVYGICVSDNEDADMVPVTDNPCDASAKHTDLFSFDLLETEKTAVPGEEVVFSLLITSDFRLDISLDKQDGPRMQIAETSILMPGDETVDIKINAPGETGDYTFTIVAKVGNCDKESCEKTVTGTLHVSDSPGAGFSIELSPKNKDVRGLKSATYFLTIHNFESSQTFTVAVDVSDSLETDFTPMDIFVGEAETKRLSFVVIPKSEGNRLNYIKSIVQDADGNKKIAEATLTVDEAVSDARRAVENNGDLRDRADEYESQYNEGAGLEEWENFNGNIIRHEDSGGEPDGDEPVGGFNWLLLIPVAVALVAVVFYYIYKKSSVSEELQSENFQPI